MMNSSVAWLAVASSYILQIVRLPSHCWRLASIRLAAHRTVFELQQAARAEVQAFRHAIDAIVALENEAVDTDVSLVTSKRLVLERLRTAQSRLRTALNEGLR